MVIVYWTPVVLNFIIWGVDQKHFLAAKLFCILYGSNLYIFCSKLSSLLGYILGTFPPVGWNHLTLIPHFSKFVMPFQTKDCRTKIMLNSFLQWLETRNILSGLALEYMANKKAICGLILGFLQGKLHVCAIFFYNSNGK